MKGSLASILVAASSIASIVQAQPILYGATAGGEGAPSALYTIDPATGAATPVGAGIGFDRCSALEASTAGVLFAACTNSEGSRVLVTIDRNTGVGTEIGPLGLQVGNVTDVSFAPDGTLYGYVQSKSPILLTIDTTDGSASSVGNPTTGGSGNALAFDSTVLYHAGDDDLSTIDPADASSAPHCTLAFPDSLGGGRINAMDENPATGVVFGSLRLFEVPQGEPQNFLVTVDPTTCEVSSIGATVDGLDAIAFLVVPDLAITKADSPDPVFAGSQLTYTITVENLGLAEATNVAVSDTLPAGTTLVSTTGCDEDPAGAPTCTIASIAAGGSAEVTIVVSVATDAASPLSNTASVAASPANTDPANDSDTELTTVLPARDLSLSKTDSPDPVAAGAQLAYTLTVQNPSTAAATDVVVTDTLPAGTTLVSTTGCNEDPAGVPTCTIPSIPGGGSAVVTIVVTVSPAASGTLTNTATLAASAANLDPSNDTAIAETTVIAGDPFAIPSLSEWGMAALALLLLGVGMAFVRRM